MQSPLRRSRRTDTDAGEASRTTRPWAARATRVGLWVLVVVGALGGLVGAIRPTPAVVESTARQQLAAPDGIEGVAEIATRRWLTGELGVDRTPATGPTLAVEATEAIAMREIAADYWAVTVAAVVDTPTTATAALWYLEVGVTRTDHGLRPVGVPAVVPGPSDPTPLPGAPTSLSSPAQDDPRAVTAEAFLRALLTGAGDPVRYAAPDSAIAPIADPPFVAVTVERTAVLESDPTRTVLRVTVNAATSDDIELQTAYELVLAERDGRWEIKALSGAPTLPRDHPPASTTTTSTLPPASTTPAASPGA